MIYIYVLCVIAIVLLGTPKTKGILGETAVKVYLSTLDKEKYRLLNDIMIPNEKGTTSQIDHVIVSVYGIFVIETKNYKGWILGNENSYQWTQSLNKNTKNKFLNPIKQNKGHVNALQILLKDFPNIPYYPIVTFSTNADLKVKVTSDVVYNPKLVRTIKKYNTETISKHEVEKIYKAILSANITDKDAKKEHVKTIRSNVQEKKDEVRNNICPRCGGNLVDRKGKYGYFKGCSNFPKCRFILKN